MRLFGRSCCVRVRTRFAINRDSRTIFVLKRGRRRCVTATRTAQLLKSNPYRFHVVLLKRSTSQPCTRADGPSKMENGVRSFVGRLTMHFHGPGKRFSTTFRPSTFAFDELLTTFVGQIRSGKRTHRIIIRYGKIALRGQM